MHPKFSVLYSWVFCPFEHQIQALFASSSKNSRLVGSYDWTLHFFPNISLNNYGSQLCFHFSLLIPIYSSVTCFTNCMISQTKFIASSSPYSQIPLYRSKIFLVYLCALVNRHIENSQILLWYDHLKVIHKKILKCYCCLVSGI